MAKTKQPRLPSLNWREVEPTSHGNSRWQTLDGIFQLVCQEQCDGIPMVRLWILYQWRRGTWWRIEERKSRTAIEKLARICAVQLESDDDD
jgi:hypothetical protein